MKRIHTKLITGMALLCALAIPGITLAIQGGNSYQSPVLHAEVFQEDKNVKLKSSTIYSDKRSKVKLERKPFIISLPNKSVDDVFQVCIWTDDSIFKKVQVGLATKDVSFYSPGSGMAAERNPHATIYVDDIAHNYLYSERLVKLATNRHGISISTLGLDGKDYSVTEQEGSLYFVIFTDVNKNKFIDKGELEYFAFEF